MRNSAHAAIALVLRESIVDRNDDAVAQSVLDNWLRHCLRHASLVGNEETQRWAAIRIAKGLQAESKHQAALDLLEPLREMGPVAELLDATASALFDLGRVAEARARREQAVDLHRKAEDKAGESGTLFLLGAMDAREGKFADARKRLGRSLALRRAIGDRAGTARALHKLGSIDL